MLRSRQLYILVNHDIFGHFGREDGIVVDFFVIL